MARWLRCGTIGLQMNQDANAGNWPVIGHEWAIELLQHSLAAGRQPHAVLLAGPAQIGKRTLALALAAAINCTSKGARPCGQCRSCRLIEHDSHPDVRIVQADAGESSREGLLKIDQIRGATRGRARTAGVTYKVFVLRRSSELTCRRQTPC